MLLANHRKKWGLVPFCYPYESGLDTESTVKMEEARTTVRSATLLKYKLCKNAFAEHASYVRFSGEAKIQMDSMKDLGSCYSLFRTVVFNIFVRVM
jgi:hypothetical protein